MSYIGTTKIGKMYLGNTEIAKAYLGNTLVFQKGGGGGGLPTGLQALTYFDTDGSNYILTPIQYASGHTFKITEDVQFLGNTNGKGTGWNAGGALTVMSSGVNRYYGDGAAALSPNIKTSNRVTATVEIGTGGNTTVSAVYNGNTSSHTRSNSSLSTYAGTTGYPIGTMTSSGGGVPSDGISLRFYSISIEKDDVVVFAGIPVITTASYENAQGVTVPSGTVGIYDSVSGELYTKSGGSNDFTPSGE